MREIDAKYAICEIGRRIWTKNYVASNDGNLSCRLGKDRILATPTMISKGFMTPDDLVIVNLKGEQIAGVKKVTSEIKMHLHIYKNRNDIDAIVHAHPPHATAFAITKKQLPKCVLPEVEIFLGQIPIASYATPGTEEFAKSVDPYINQHFAFLLTNHGAVTLGKDPFDAYYKMETLDQYCMILILAKQLGELNKLDYNSMQDIFKLKEKYGISDPRDKSADYNTICSINPELKNNQSAGDNKNSSESPDIKNQIENIVRQVLKEKNIIQ